MDDVTKREGVERLKRLLPLAKAKMVSDHTLRAEARSGLAKAMATHLREDKIEAVVIYPAPRGGWHCDVLFRDMPPGMPNSMGTPVAMPLATQEKAEEHGLHLLTTILFMCKQSEAAEEEEADPTFLLFGATVTLSQQVINMLVSADPRALEGYGSKEAAVRRIQEVLDRTMPGVGQDTFQERYQKITRGEVIALVTVLHIAALSGVFAYPPRTDGTPEEGEAAMQQIMVDEAMRERLRKGVKLDA